MTALAAMSIFAAAGLLPIIGAVLADMRKEMQMQTRESAERNLAAAILAFDDLEAHINAIHGRMYADGILPDRRAMKRESRHD